jgi:hypothetical protein
LENGLAFELDLTEAGSKDESNAGKSEEAARRK